MATTKKSQKLKGPAKAGPAADNYIEIADSASLVPPAPGPAGTPRWIEDLALFATAFLVNNSERPGAPELRSIQKLAYRALAAIDANDALTAAWAGMRLLEASWRAQRLDGENIIRAGVSGFEQKRSAAKSAAEQRELAALARATLAKELAAKSGKLDKGIGAIARTVKLAAARINPATDASTQLAGSSQRTIENMIRAEIEKLGKQRR